MAVVTNSVIKVWHGIVRGDREYLIFSWSTLTIEQHASELLYLLADEDPHDDPPECRLLLGDVLALIEDATNTGRSDHLDHGLWFECHREDSRQRRESAAYIAIIGGLSKRGLGSAVAGRRGKRAARGNRGRSLHVGQPRDASWLEGCRLLPETTPAR